MHIRKVQATKDMDNWIGLLKSKEIPTIAKARQTMKVYKPSQSLDFKVKRNWAKFKKPQIIMMIKNMFVQQEQVY